jgi:hypothetical protein
MPITFETKAFATLDATISNTVINMTQIGFTLAQLSQVKRALVTVDAQSIRMTYDGSTPSATFGHLAGSNVASFYLEGNQNVKNLQFFRGGGTDAEITITLEKDLG